MVAIQHEICLDEEVLFQHYYYTKNKFSPRVEISGSNPGLKMYIVSIYIYDVIAMTCLLITSVG